jgi:hypothetical protein
VTVLMAVLLSSGNPLAHPELLIMVIGMVTLPIGLYQVITGRTPPTRRTFLVSGWATQREIRWTGLGLLFIGVASGLLYAAVTGLVGAPIIGVIVVASLGLAAAAINRAVQVRRGTRS